jgi:hypothetical protein
MILALVLLVAKYCLVKSIIDVSLVPNQGLLGNVQRTIWHNVAESATALDFHVRIFCTDKKKCLAEI